MVLQTLLSCSGLSAPAMRHAPIHSGYYIRYFPHREFKEKDLKTVLLWDQDIPLSGGCVHVNGYRPVCGVCKCVCVSVCVTLCLSVYAYLCVFVY